MEYLEGGELFERIVDDEDDLLESDCSSYVRQIVSGLEYLQSRGIVHLDIEVEAVHGVTSEGVLHKLREATRHGLHAVPVEELEG